MEHNCNKHQQLELHIFLINGILKRHKQEKHGSALFHCRNVCNVGSYRKENQQAKRRIDGILLAQFHYCKAAQKSREKEIDMVVVSDAMHEASVQHRPRVTRPICKCAVCNAFRNTLYICKSQNIVSSIVIACPQEGEARHPRNDDNHENICPAEHEMTLAGLRTVKLSFNGVVCLGQVHQEHAAPI